MTAPAVSTRRAPDDATPPAWNRARCREIGERLFSMMSVPQASLMMASGMNGYTRFTRGDMYTTDDGNAWFLSLTLGGDGSLGQASTTRVDDEGLRILVEQAQRAAGQRRGPPSEWTAAGARQFLDPLQLWYDSTIEAMRPERRAKVCYDVLDAAEAAGVDAFGIAFTGKGSRAIMTNQGLFGYSCSTGGGLNVTARTKDGTGSGAAYMTFEDVRRGDYAGTIARAVGLAVRSARPVAVEPGRYTVIMEPDAVADFLQWVDVDAKGADEGETPFAKDPRGNNKVGLKVFDERLTLLSDPLDPDIPTTTFSMYGDPWERVTWIEHGVLKHLAYSRSYAKQKHREPLFEPEGRRLAVEGPTQSFEEMVASTKRGIWVNHVSSMYGMRGRTGLVSGTTRDGTFLIENGKITKSVKNFRFTDSPMFLFNQIEAIGVPERTVGRTVVPRLKVRDFAFTSLTDAV